MCYYQVAQWHHNARPPKPIEIIDANIEIERNAPQIVVSMMELIKFYVYVMHEFFASDLSLSGVNLYTVSLCDQLNRISAEIIPKVRNWRSDMSIVRII